MSISDRLQQLGIELPPPPAPIARFLPAVEAGGLLFLSGLAPLDENGKAYAGIVGRDYSAEQAQHFARLVGINLLAVARASLGSLDRVTRVVKVFGMVNATPDFTRHPFVIDGCSNLFWDVFGDSGMHARTAMGAGSLPGRIPLEIEAVLKVRS
ncbi:enamine deaminase RidA (YjgF/YER057c/UK114 family) [Rhizobium sp. BK529]|uniref:RidA family protein n=1 Tax=Rhizobium sp. BK529 TaxID=2586983 RepID=UPI00161CFF92|nr:RidA family protein [Rhizobium sp. BK529]MBB3594879.1 enamine deaminase RidA (YjgF/YER057c/UK114 family) [Rhizobium sp. BK529]